MEELHFARTLDYALGVPYSHRFDFAVTAPFGGDASSAEAAFAQAGGLVKSVLENVNIILGSIPDDSVESLRSQPQFLRIEIPASRCSDG